MKLQKLPGMRRATPIDTRFDACCILFQHRRLGLECVEYVSALEGQPCEMFVF